MKLTTTLSIFAIFLTFQLDATVRYVTPSGAGLQDGTSWSNAFAGDQLQDAIDLSADGDEVWVAAGTYRTTTTTDRSIAFHMKSGVVIYGSFAGTETQLQERNLASGITSVLTGEIGAVGNSDNSYHVISNYNLLPSAEIDGFVISDANDDRSPSLSEGLGGGVYNDGSGSGNFCNPHFTNCIIINNQAVFGAGVFNNGYDGGSTSANFLNCVIAYNHATTGGGGMDNFGLLNGNASPVLQNCIIYNNTAAYRAGGMYCWGGNNGNTTPMITNSVFFNNSAVDGGAIVTDNLNASTGNSGTSEPVLKNTIMWGNTASGTGPQFFVLGTAEISATFSDIDLTNQNAPHVISGPQMTNIESDPLFVNSFLGEGADGDWMTDDDGFQLQSNSPCINFGSNVAIPLNDILGVSRFISGNPDIGAYEYNPSASIDSEETDQQIIVFPNPSSGIVSIRSTSGLDEIVHLSIVNIEGKVLIEFNNLVSINGLLNVQLDFSGFESGIYQIELQTSSGKMVKQFMKQ